MSSNAIGVERVSRIIGYLLKKGNFSLTSPNLPQRIAILGEANTSHQATLDTEPYEFTSLKQVGERYGYGSPLYSIARILRPVNGDGVAGIPTVIYPQAQAEIAGARSITVAPSGVATGNGTHFVVVAGRDNVDGSVYAIEVVEGDTAAEISDKIADAVNNVLASPVTADSSAYNATLTTKWKGQSANGLQVSIDTGDDDLGLSYAVAVSASGYGTPSISASLTSFGNIWNTIVINSYGTVSTIMSALEAYNGKPHDTLPTGRYTGNVWKPFIALTGSVADDPTEFTDERDEDVTIAICPAPASKGLPMEAAANMCVLFALVAQNNPHLDVCGQSYPDMPTPTTSIGSMADYNSRDSFVKKGCSTVDLVSGRYQVQDFVTTYHPDGETPPQFRYCRNLNIDWNVRYGYYLKEQESVADHMIANNDDVVAVDSVIKPKQWIQIIGAYAEDLTNRGLTVDAAFMQASIEVGISTTNPDRLETFFRYKRSGVARITATTAEAGFNFGSNT